MLISENGGVPEVRKYYQEIVQHELFWWKARAYLSTVSYLTILQQDLLPYQACENFSDALHDVILAPTSGGRLHIAQVKIAWRCMLESMQVKICQSGCTVLALTDNEMFWKHHWSWQSGPRASGISEQPTPETPPVGRANDSYVQSLLDQNRSFKDQNRSLKDGKGQGKSHFGARRGQGGQRWKKEGGGGFHQEDGQRVPPPPAPGAGASAGKRFWENRKKRKGGGH